MMSNPKLPKYHRQRFLLQLLDQIGGPLSKLYFQKLLFVLHKEADVSYYDFVPYKYGCYSFQAQADVKLFETFGWIEEKKEAINLLTKPTELKALDDDISSKIDELIKRFPKHSKETLIRYVYKHYPYYATRSEIAKEYSDNASYKKIYDEKSKLKKKAPIVYTIGYEGLSFEAYVNLLLRHNVRLLCDVRNNPLSRKANFSKGALNMLLPKFGIRYVHLPDLGISSEMRQSLNSAHDYAQLFYSYKKMLPQKTKSLVQLKELFRQHQRIALTCYEKDHRFCHRHCISERLNEDGINIAHI